MVLNHLYFCRTKRLVKVVNRWLALLGRWVWLGLDSIMTLSAGTLPHGIVNLVGMKGIRRRIITMNDARKVFKMRDLLFLRTWVLHNIGWWHSLLHLVFFFLLCFNLTCTGCTPKGGVSGYIGHGHAHWRFKLLDPFLVCRHVLPIFHRRLHDARVIFLRCFLLSC